MLERQEKRKQSPLPLAKTMATAAVVAQGAAAAEDESAVSLQDKIKSRLERKRAQQESRENSRVMSKDIHDINSLSRLSGLSEID